MTALMSVIPLPLPELVIVPVWFTAVVDSVMPLAVVVLLLRVRLPVPVVPPETVKSTAPLLLLVSVVPPLFTVRAVVLIVSAEVVLLSVIDVTFAPTPPLIVTVPLLEPVFVIVPVLLKEAVLTAIVLVVPELLMVTFPTPVIPPLIVMVPVVPVLDTVRLLPFSPIAPLKVGAVVVPLLPIVSVPTALVPKFTALETVNVFAKRLAEPPAELPRVMGEVEGPAAPLVVPTLLTLAITVPCMIVRPPVNVFAWLRVNVPVPL